MDSRRPFTVYAPCASFIVRVVRGRRGVQLELIDLHSGEQRPLRSLDELWWLLQRLAPGLR